MKILSVVGMVMVIAGCSAHPVRCRGALQPINTPVAAVKQPKAVKEPKVVKEPHP
jgi:hypothetical protein